MLELFLASHIERDDRKSYGLGVYRYETNTDIAYYALNSDFGVDFFTVYFPSQKISASALGNMEMNTYPLLQSLLSTIVF